MGGKKKSKKLEGNKDGMKGRKRKSQIYQRNCDLMFQFTNKDRNMQCQKTARLLERKRTERMFTHRNTASVTLTDKIII
jgi:hypothetical protein